ncbi:flavodoxin [Jiulongibacter sediminis]|mgnify:CR=1 FL=1|jgi:flavodoxin|uniref:flavodoxin n=1 Tax=Jiulongibacter sediminis TaxID=1605367 RepID=UPI0026EB87A0|nr:flavodoxin [Jiulongibacter sediminis]
MNRQSVIYLFLIFLTGFSCTKAQKPDDGQILIVYLSRTQNTQTLAEIIHKKVGGDMVALEMVNPYPENYQEIVKQVSEELDEGFLPPLKTKVDIDQYDIVFLGFPTWAMQLPPPVQSFLSQYPMEGKTLIPFNTNAGYGLGSTIDTIKKLCPKATLKKEFSMVGGKERDGIFLTIVGKKAQKTEKEVDDWLHDIGVLK